MIDLGQAIAEYSQTSLSQFGQAVSTAGDGFALDAIVNTIPIPLATGGLATMFDLKADNFATNGGSTQTLVVAAGQLPLLTKSTPAPIRVPRCLMPSSCLMIALPLLIAGAGEAQSTPADPGEILRVIVKGESGVIAGARVNVNPRDSAAATVNSRHAEGITNSSGQFLASLPPGRYDVSASLKGWMPAGGRIAISGGQRKPTEIRLVLRYPDCRVVHCEL